MYISSNDWNNYIDKLSACSRTAAAKMKSWIQKNGFFDIDAMIDYAYALVTKYGEGAAALSAEMYDVIAEMQGKLYASAEMASTPEHNEVGKAINGVLKHSQNTDAVSAPVYRLVKRTGADTILKNAIRDKAQFAWIPNGDTCAFCLTLASRGWQDISDKALKNGHAEHIHANCDCTYAVRFDGKSGVQGYEPDKYRELYDNAEGDTPEEKINSMRRAQYEKNKDEINAKKREAYALKTELNKETENDRIDNMIQSLDITEKYTKHATPDICNVIKENGFIEKDHETEIAFAEWVKKVFGGDIIHNKDHKEKHYADYTWNGKLWELKSIQSGKYNTIDQHIRDGNKQISENRGGLFIDITNNSLSIEEMNANILRSMEKRHIDTTDVMIKKDDIYKVYRNN